MKQILQLRLFDAPEVVAVVESKRLSSQASELIQACKGHDAREQEKTLRLSREWVRHEVSDFLGFSFPRMSYDYPVFIAKLNQYISCITTSL